MICKDPSITYLKDYGYNVVRLPKANMNPLQIYLAKGRILHHLGDLSSVIMPRDASTTLPVVNKDKPAAHISGKRTSDLSLGLGLSILGSVIGAMGGGKLGLDAQYKNARTISFEFIDVLEDSIQITELDKYLGSSDIDPFSVHVTNLLESDDVYVLTSVIKTDKIKVEGKKENNTEIEVEVPVIKEIVGGKVSISGSGEKSKQVTYAGTTPLVFGFQAIRLYYEDGKYTAFKPAKAGGMAANLPNDKSDFYLSDTPFISLNSPL